MFNDTELLKKIFKNLDLNDLLKCRQVNQKWKRTVEDLRLSSLSVKAKDGLFQKTSIHDYNSVNKSCLFETENTNFLQAKVMETMLSNLKHLFIHFPRPNSQKNQPMKGGLYSFIGLLNQMHQLVRLEIDCLHLIKKSSLRLAKLKYLSIPHISGHILTIDCPKLSTFETKFNLHKFEFVHPASIRYYTTELYEQGVEQFVNLFSYWCRNCYNMKTGLLKLLPKLKYLSCREDVRIELLSDLLSDRLKLRRPEFAVSYAGLMIQTSRDLSELPKSRAGGFLFSVNESFQIFLDNYAKLSRSLPYIETINYNALIDNKHFSGAIDLSKFFKRFKSIKKLELNGPITDKQQFAKFISWCDDLRILELHNGGLSQEFYGALPASQPNIVGLSIAENGRLLDLEFLGKFKRLVCLFVDQVPTFYEFRRAFDLPRFKMFCFMSADREFQVKKSRLKRETCEIVVIKNQLSKPQSPKSIYFQGESELHFFVSRLLFQLEDLFM